MPIDSFFTSKKESPRVKHTKATSKYIKDCLYNNEGMKEGWSRHDACFARIRSKTATDEDYQFVCQWRRYFHFSDNLRRAVRTAPLNMNAGISYGGYNTGPR